MQFFFVASLLACVSAKNVTLSEVYGAAPTVEVLEPWSSRTLVRKAQSTEFFDLRAPEDCVFPLELMIIQDATASFQDDYAIMKDTQLPLLISAMRTTHPNSKFGVTSFRDKPIWSLGEPNTDYCSKFELPLTDDTDALLDVYANLVSTGGGDPSENQFGALIATAQSQTAGWSNPDATRLIVVSTDAPPHFADDGLNNYGMSAYSGSWDEANAAGQCLEQYYPSPAQVRTAISNREAYVAFIIFDGSWWNELPTTSWEWFNNYLGQTSEFVEPLGNSSTKFWESLSKIIKKIEDIECQPKSTVTPATPAATTLAATTTAPAATTVPGATTDDIITVTIPGGPECPPCETGPCPPCKPCHCHGHHGCHCAEVIIKLAHRPKRMRLEVEN